MTPRGGRETDHEREGGVSDSGAPSWGCERVFTIERGTRSQRRLIWTTSRRRLGFPGWQTVRISSLDNTAKLRPPARSILKTTSLRATRRARAELARASERVARPRTRAVRLCFAVSAPSRQQLPRQTPRRGRPLTARSVGPSQGRAPSIEANGRRCARRRGRWESSTST